ncbi:MAG: NAD(P)H-dependent oxidoreductase [Candidatus Pacebacteria bacterium]|nr:NAD(P)H-dependent oxidoreductase [Candidatus Paceibacterota bacterium]
MNTLIVTAHPSSKGFTHQIAEAYKKGREAKALALGIADTSSVEILDLYKTDIKQDFLRYEEKADMGNPDPAREAMQAKITAADNIVIVHPMWWVSPPAIMKNFIDVNFAAHFAFRYINGKPVGLLTGKTAAVFITCDGPRWLYWLIAMPFRTIWIHGILQYCGLKVKAFKLFDRKMFRTEDEKTAFLQKVEKIAKKI